MITAREFLSSCDDALDQMEAVARSLGDDLVSVTLPAAGNSVFGLAAHCVGVMGRWARMVNRGIVVPRDRDAEFLAAGTVAEAVELLELGRVRLHEDVAATEDFRALSLNPPEDQAPQTCGAVLLHVYEELTQHLGQMEVIRDVLLAERRARP